MSCEIHQDDVGTRFLVTISDCVSDSGVDLSTLSSKFFNFKKPDDTVIARVPLLFSDGSANSGVLYYDTIASDLDQAGVWKLQVKLGFPSGTYHTDIYNFKVHPNL